jgi:hypothetical protein
MNPNGYNLLEKNNRLKFNTICRTPTKNALQLVIKNIGNMIEKDWSILSGNPAAIQLLTANQKKIDWSELSANPNAIKLLRDNGFKIDLSHPSLKGFDVNVYIDSDYAIPMTQYIYKLGVVGYDQASLIYQKTTISPKIIYLQFVGPTTINVQITVI